MIFKISSSIFNGRHPLWAVYVAIFPRWLLEICFRYFSFCTSEGCGEWGRGSGQAATANTSCSSLSSAPHPSVMSKTWGWRFYGKPPHTTAVAPALSESGLGLGKAGLNCRQTSFTSFKGPKQDLSSQVDTQWNSVGPSEFHRGFVI